MAKAKDQRSRKAFSMGRVTIAAVLLLLLFLIICVPGFPPDFALMGQMKKVQDQRSATELRTAIENFYSEYGVLPRVSSVEPGHDAMITTRASDGLLPQLMGNNPGEILFFSEPTAKAEGKTGLWYPDGDTSQVTLRGNWGEPFVVFLDTNGDNLLLVPSRTVAGDWETIEKRAAVVSTGPDKMIGGDENDDIYAY